MPRRKETQKGLTYFVIVAVLAVSACGTSQQAAKLNQPFTLKVGSKALLSPGVSVEFLEVMSDSRCPRSVQCIQAGEAIARVELSVSGQNRVLELGTNATVDKPAIANALGYRVELQDLLPYPAVPGKPDPFRYSVKLKVSKA